MKNREFYKDEIVTIGGNNMRVSKLEAFLNKEHKVQILDYAEKKYLRNIVLPFYDRVMSVKKIPFSDEASFISIKVASIDNNEILTEKISLPLFYNDEMYINMNPNKFYTLQELDIKKNRG